MTHTVHIKERDPAVSAAKEVTLPVCPYCKTTMTAKYFSGYYESFPMWTCRCKKIPRAKTVRGSYA